MVGTAYSFRPTVAAAPGATLSFSIQNKPAWANFDMASGMLSGTPTAANVGTYSNIVVSVSNGTSSAALPAYTLTVTQSANATATVDWTPPTENSDGSALSNLAGYKVYYGTSAKNLNQVVQVPNPGVATYTVSNLSSGTWYFAVSAYTTAGTESTPSGVVSATL